MKNLENNVSTNAKFIKFVLAFSFFFISATIYASELSEYNQTKKFTFEFKNVPIKDLIKHIEKESEYVFFYYADVFDDSKKTSIRVIDLPVDEILNKLFDGTSVSYEIKDRQILLKKKETAPASKSTTNQRQEINPRIGKR
ncbi:STN domain-containing protein [Bacteroides sp. BFG-606]|uniref:STN domain-containing protein n=1 Tax=Bacteroides sp. BFG-606 TaxID=2972763 RepID=UPI0021653F24|nr:STN domain-containing protein [Bacteroides sp. BFG-606]MCS2334485.1 STN domain-containing protein [Bacteroides sp. BFG-606]